MTKPPAGMLSLTYHLAYVDFYRKLWLSGQYETCYTDFGIVDAKQKEAIAAINEKLGTANAGARDTLVDEWMGLVGNDVKAGAANPMVLW